MPRILLIGGDADFNVGDAAIQHALCATLAGLQPGVRITTVSALAAGPRPPGVTDVLPKGFRHAATQWRAARRHDLVVVGGGGLFQDDDSRVKMPYWATRLAALRAASPLIAGHSLGAGPLEHGESRALARLACATMRSISVRDEIARLTLQACMARPVRVVPDPAFMLEAAPREQARRYLKDLGSTAGRPLIGVVMRRWYHQRGGFVPHRMRVRLGMDRNAGTDRMQALLEQVSLAVSRLADRLQADVLLLPSYPAAHEGDVAACEALAVQIRGATTHVARIASPTLYKAVTGELQLMISARMHPLILASGMGVPLVGIGYNSKFAGCLDMLGIPEQLLWLDEMCHDSAAARIEQLAMTALEKRVDIASRAAALARRSHEAASELLKLPG